MALLLAAQGLTMETTDNTPLRTVPSVDLQRYAGRWFELARLPNRFQLNCDRDTSATYTLRPDGTITVVNQCRQADGQMKSVQGTAHTADAGNSARLKVTFFAPFSGDYWVIGLDPEYRWALVGEPGRKYLWLLSREPRMEEAEVLRILDTAAAQGYDLKPLIRTRQGA